MYVDILNVLPGISAFVASQARESRQNLPEIRYLVWRKILRRRGFSLIELVTVLTILLVLSYFALPALEIVQVKSREKLLQQRLFDMRRAIDSYAKAIKVGENPYPPSIASLTEPVPDTLLRNGADTGPFLSASGLGNPFATTDDVFIWDIRDGTGDPDSWKFDQTDSTKNYASGVYDVRYPVNSVGGWRKAIDETFYQDW
jgi:prepilin-type N-terminal cleavage/methylation domain-containing protein